MNKKTVLVVAALAVVGVVTSFLADATANGAKKPGLIGIQYGTDDFTDVQNPSKRGRFYFFLIGATAIFAILNSLPAGKGRNEWGYGKTAEMVENHIEKLTKVLLGNPHISGFCYTQLTDVEQEINGIYTYDRKLKFDAKQLKKIFASCHRSQ